MPGISTELLRLSMLLTGILLTGAAIAEADDDSHRLLPLPSSGTAGIQQQLQFLQRLQRQVRQQDPDVTERAAQRALEELAADLDPQQLQTLRQLMEQWSPPPGDSGTLPDEIPDTGFDPQSLSPSLQRAMKDPQMREQAQRMLEQFHRNRQLPIDRDARNMTGPGPGERRSSNDDASTDREPPFPDGSRGQTVRPREDSSRPAGDEQPKSTSRWLREMLTPKQPTGNRSADSTSPDSLLGASRQPAGPTGASGNETRRTSPANMDGELADEIERRSRQGRQPRGGVGPEPVHNAGSATAQSSLSPQSSAPKRATAERSTPLLPKEFLDPLDSRELRRAFQDILKEARASSAGPAGPENHQAGDASEAPLSPEMRRSVMEALDGIREEVTEIVKEARVKPRQQPQSAPASTPPRGRQSSSPSSPSTTTRIQNSASDWFQRLSEAPTAGPEMSGPGAGVAPGFSATSLMNVLLILGVIGVGGAFLRKSYGAQSVDANATMEDLSLVQITCAADIVKAFHQLVAITRSQTEVWWPHRRAADALALEAPSSAVAATTLADLYEQVRYAPPATPLTPEQLEEARAALRRCAKC